MKKTMSNIVLNNEGQYIPSHIIEMTRTFAFVTPIQKL